ncbi:MAG TPA: gas vesicle synthesis GvpLGvpF [Lentisphaeria bacterium]|nr:MAG: gas vesicle synthesis GvpLGvpF [Lentisphaerae bacterium GWF2_38_69]HBM16048.1 gas vesicle synthesis GvpLGvpF [Lentisphaeria bacterium]
MSNFGHYIYCIISTEQDRNFGPIGINNEEVLTIGYDNLAMVLSLHPIGKVVVNSDNMLTHEKVIEKVMEEFPSVLPVRFGTIAASADEVRNLLDKRRREFCTALKEADHMVELNIKGSWKNLNSIFKEIEQENLDIKKVKNKINKTGTEADEKTRIEIGKKVKEALQKKKEEEAEKIIDHFRRIIYDYKLNRTSDDSMFINAAFLVGKGHEKDFDNTINDLSNDLENKVKFSYIGPLPLFNFVNITIYPEEWEK